MGLQFHETGYGKIFFGNQLPNLIKALNRVAEALEEKTPTVWIARCVKDGTFDGKLLFQRGRIYILVPAEAGYYDVYDRETGNKTECTWMDLDGHFERMKERVMKKEMQYDEQSGHFR